VVSPSRERLHARPPLPGQLQAQQRSSSPPAAKLQVRISPQSYTAQLHHAIDNYSAGVSLQHVYAWGGAALASPFFEALNFGIIFVALHRL
jgi:hypothetical protein